MATVNSASAQLSMIPMLNGTNYVTWKETVEIVLGCMDLDLALRKEQPVPTTDDPKTDQIDKWERSNRMCLAIMKRTIPTGFRGSIAESTSAKKFLSEIEQYFAKNEKAETSNLLSKLVTMKYKGKGNIREYIIGMSNLAGKLKELKLELSDELLVHLVLISLPPQFGHFVVSYNTQKEIGLLMSSFHTVCKRRRGFCERRLKVLTWHRALMIRKKREVRILQVENPSNLRKRSRIRDQPVTFVRRLDI